MKRSKTIGCVIAAAVVCLVGITNAAYVSEPFDAHPDGGTNWTANWGETSATLHSISLGSESPIKDGGSYLVYRTTVNGTNSVYRDFDPSIAEGVFTVKMNVRVDELGNYFAGPDISDRIQVFGETTNASGDLGTYSSWGIMSTATTANDNWYVYNGDKTGKWSSGYLKDSGIPIVAGGVYSFTITAYPATLSFDATISDGTTVFTRLNNGYRGGPTLNPSDRICFGNKIRAASVGGTPLQLSYDSIRIFANGAYAPAPTNGQLQVPTAGTVLSWRSGMVSDPADPNAYDPIPNPAITGHYVYLSPANDPALPTTPVFVPADADSNGQVDEIASYALSSALEKDATYYWRVDESLGASGPGDDPNLIKGVVRNFLTEVTIPVVDAGQNVVTYLEEGTATVQLDPDIDWFNPQSQLLWSVVSQPAGAPEGSVQFDSASIENPTVTINYAGKPYVLKLWALDTKGGFAENTLQIDVYADSCQAARNVLGYQAIASDINNDCRVNIDDLSLLAADWLEQNFLLENVLY